MIALNLFDSVPDGNAQIANVTNLLQKSWRRSFRRIGGCWLGTAEIDVTQADRSWLDEMFTYGLLREIRERGGGQETWRGAIVKMEYTRGNDLFVRDASRMANAIRSIYTRIGDNLLTNGSGESGAWTAYNGATIVQDAGWASHGTYSIKVTVGDTAIRGAVIQSGVAIVAGQQYVIRATLKVSSGSWRLSSNRADTDESLAYYSTHGEAGDHVVEIEIPESNTYAGLVDLRITAEAAVGIVNVDACVFQTGPTRAETGWYTDGASIVVHGRKEDVLLRAGKSNADANAECASELLDRAWPRPMPPQSSSTKRATATDKLRLTVAGYWAMLNWVYTTVHGTRAASDWVTTLAGLQTTYVTPHIIESNTLDFFVDDRAPLRVGDLLRDIAKSGNSDGDKYSVGVWPGRRLQYEQVEAELSYYRRGGKLIQVSGGETEPWLARPGYALWQDMPIGPGAITGQPQHDPRWVYLEEVEMLPSGDIEFRMDAI